MAPISPFRVAIRMSSRATTYSHAKTGSFSQVGPVMHNPFRDDPLLDRTLRRLLPQKDYDKIAADLDRFGERCVTEIYHLGRQTELNQPSLEQHDAWGKRVDKLNVCPEWYRLKEICAEEGVVALGYDKTVSDDPVTRRLYQIAKLYLYSPTAGLTTCPMAMTDGAVKTLEALGLYGKHPLATEAVDRLLSRDGKRAWTSGQWMTEKGGGSDVAGGCDTYATHVEGDKYHLHGYKWFSSAIDADVALTLARVVDKDGKAVEGTKGLSLFLLRIRDDEGNLNGIQMVRLKNKLGTKQLPTAELLLDGCVAQRIGDEGRGVSGISNMLNITRIHNAVASISGMRRITSLARDYATRRVVFGQPQAKWPLHTATLSRLEVQTRACFFLLIEATRLLGISESGKATLTEATLLRLITPVLKLFAGKLCVPHISEGIECFGGQGYIEDTGLPSALRDAQVTPIWEGTTNVLSLDVLRVFAGKENVLLEFGKHINQILSKAMRTKELDQASASLKVALGQLQKMLKEASESALKDSVRVDAVARDISFAIARIYSGALLVESASDSTAKPSDEHVAYRWCCEQPLVDLRAEWMSTDRVQQDRDIVFENYQEYARQAKL